jgi:hypothetical protein
MLRGRLFGAALLAGAFAAAGSAAAASSGSHAPSSATRKAIVATIHADPSLGSPGVYNVVNIRVATGNQYARANTAPAHHAQYQGALVLLKLTGRTWHVTEFGSADLGCNLPAKIQQDLDVIPPRGTCQADT